MSSDETASSRYLFVPWVILFLGLALTHVLQGAARESARQALQAEFDGRTGEIIATVDRRLHNYEQILEGAIGLFAVSSMVGRHQFVEYVRNLKLEGKYHGIQGVGFSRLITPRDLVRHVAAIRAEGLRDYDVRPAGEREVYSAIVYLEPADWRNQRAIGYDMYSEPVRRAAMERARDEERTTISGKVRLVQETEQNVQAGFLMYLPVYRPQAPHETVAERRENLVGWIYAPFRMHDLMEGMLGTHLNEASALLDLEIYDGDGVERERLMFDSSGPADFPAAAFKTVRRMPLFDHQWTVSVRSLPEFDARLQGGKANVIAGAGTMASVLLALVVWLLATGRARALAMAESVTAEVRQSEANQRKLNRALRLLSDCNMALVHAEDERALLAEICRLCVDTGGYLMAWVGYAEQDEAKTVRPVAQSGYEEGYLAQADITWADNEPGQGPTGTAIRTGQPDVNPNVMASPRMAPWRAAALQRGYLSSVALPLIGDAQTIGALTIYAREADAFDPEEIRLLEELAGDLAFGIKALRARSEQRRAEGEIRRLNEELERRVAERTAQLEAANKELDAFAHSVSHDLRAPLRTLDGFARILHDDEAANLSPDGKRTVERIWRNAKKMEALIDDILQFSRISQMEMRWQEADMAALARGVLEEMRADYPAAQVRIADLPRAMGDAAMLRQVWVNLIGNALKFTAKRERPEIEIGSETQNDETVFYIRDNGAGFDMAHAGKLFGVFQRMHTEKDFPGTGAGLSIVRRIVERHGGRIWAEAEMDKGATFRFTLAS